MRKVWKQPRCARPGCHHKFTEHAGKCQGHVKVRVGRIWKKAPCECGGFISQKERAAIDAGEVRELEIVARRNRDQYDHKIDWAAAKNPCIEQDEKNVWHCKYCSKKGPYDAMKEHWHWDRFIRIKAQKKPRRYIQSHKPAIRKIKHKIRPAARGRSRADLKPRRKRS